MGPSRPLPILALAGLALLLGAGCATSVSGVRPRGFPADALPLDLARFMGDWFVVAHIPTPTEAEAHEAVESYALREDGSIDVRFRFCEGSLDGEVRELRMDGWVHDPATNAEWRVRPLWPLRLAYQIRELDPEYRETVITHPSGRYAWVMARRPELREARLAEITDRLAALGFETERMRRVPHADGACRAGA